MSDLWQTIKNFFVHQNQHLYYGRIPDVRAPGTAAPSAVKAGQAYFRLILTEVYLENDRTWFQEWYPVTHALVQLSYGGVTVTVPYVAGPGALKDLDEAHLNRVIQLNRALTGQLPFNGGSVGVQAGLMAMKGDNQLASVLKVVSDISGLLAVPQLSAVLNIAAPIANGVQGLLASSNGGLQLGLDQTFTSVGGGANDLRAGYFVAIAASKAKADADRLWVIDDQLHVGDAAADAVPYEKAAYMLFRMEIAEEHENYEGLTSIQSHIDEAYKLLAGNAVEEASVRIKLAVTEAIASKDLTLADRRRRVEAIAREYKERKELLAGVGFEAAPRRASDTADQALARGPLGFAEAMRLVDE